MIQLAYVSEASMSLASDEVFKIIETSAKNNMRDDLTGFLIFTNHRFFQVIEGPEDAIEALLSRLMNDPRHSGLEILSRKAIDQRAFARWRMKRVMADARFWSADDTDPAFQSVPLSARQAATKFLEGAALPLAAI